jgi:hypothetical protein
MAAQNQKDVPKEYPLQGHDWSSLLGATVSAAISASSSA